MGVLKELDEGEDDTTLPLPNITTQDLRTIVRFLHHYHKDPFPAIPRTPITAPPESYVNGWWCKFLGDIRSPLTTLQAAHYLDLAPLTELIGALYFAYKLNSQTTRAQVCQFLGIKPDYTPQEIRRLTVDLGV